MVKYGYYPTALTLTHINTAKSNNRRLLLVFAFSILVHLFVMMWIGELFIRSRANIPEINQPLSILIIPSHISVMKTPVGDDHILKKNKVLDSSQLKSNLLLADKASHRTEESQTNGVNNEPLITKQGISKIPSSVFIQQVYDSIPSIVEKMDKQQMNTGAYTIFDPKLRKAIEQARRKKEENKQRKLSSNTHSYIEVTGTYGDYIGVRINNQCWRVPIDNGHDQFSAKVWLFDFACPKQHVKLFNNIKR